MFYRNDDIPQGYNKIAEISDNYLVWVRESTLESGTNYSAYIQFLNPSEFLVFTDNYKITSGTSYEYNAHYTNNGMYSYIDYYDCDFSRTTMSVDSDDFATGIYDRADAPTIFICLYY